jgi:hypothetical protein
MSEKSKIRAMKNEPKGYVRLSWEKYLDKLEEYELKSDDITDTLGLKKDVEEREYLFFFKHPKLKFYVDKIIKVNVMEELEERDMYFFGDIVVRDFSYYSESIMTKQVQHFEDVLRNLYDAYHGKLIDSKRIYNSKIVFKNFWLDIVIEQMETILKNHEGAKEYNNYYRLYEHVIDIRLDLENKYPVFNTRYNINNFTYGFNDLQLLFDSFPNIGKIIDSSGRIELHFSGKEVVFLIMTILKNNKKEVNKTEIGNFIISDFLFRGKGELKTRTMKDYFSFFNNPENILPKFKLQNEGIEFFTSYLKYRNYL